MTRAQSRSRRMKVERLWLKVDREYMKVERLMPKVDREHIKVERLMPKVDREHIKVERLMPKVDREHIKVERPRCNQNRSSQTLAPIKELCGSYFLIIVNMLER